MGHRPVGNRTIYLAERLKVRTVVAVTRTVVVVTRTVVVVTRKAVVTRIAVVTRVAVVSLDPLLVVTRPNAVVLDVATTSSLAVVLLVVVLLSKTLVVMGISISTLNLLQEFMHRLEESQICLSKLVLSTDFCFKADGDKCQFNQEATKSLYVYIMCISVGSIIISTWNLNFKLFVLLKKK